MRSDGAVQLHAIVYFTSIAQQLARGFDTHMPPTSVHAKNSATELKPTTEKSKF